MSNSIMEKLSKIFEKYRDFTDKGTGHSYIEVYEELFAPLRDKEIRLLEVGIGSGASLRMWTDYFLKGEIYGIDISEPPVKMVAHPRIHTFQFNVVDIVPVEKFFDAEQFDIIIDDASHKIEEQLLAVCHLFPKLKKEGLYIVEDIDKFDYTKYFQCFANVKILDRRHIKNNETDILVIIEKKK